MLWVNLFVTGSALLETGPQGDASISVSLPEETEAVLTGLADTPETSSALAALFLAGASAGERGAKKRP